MAWSGATTQGLANHFRDDLSGSVEDLEGLLAHMHDEQALKTERTVWRKVIAMLVHHEGSKVGY